MAYTRPETVNGRPPDLSGNIVLGPADIGAAPPLADGGVLAGVGTSTGFWLVGTGGRFPTGYPNAPAGNPAPGGAGGPGYLGGFVLAGLSVAGSVHGYVNQSEHTFKNTWPLNNSLAIWNTARNGYSVLRALDYLGNEGAAFGFNNPATDADTGILAIESSNIVKSDGSANNSSPARTTGGGFVAPILLTTTGKHSNPAQYADSFPRVKVENNGTVNFLRMHPDHNFYPVLSVKQVDDGGGPHVKVRGATPTAETWFSVQTADTGVDVAGTYLTPAGQNFLPLAVVAAGTREAHVFGTNGAALALSNFAPTVGGNRIPRLVMPPSGLIGALRVTPDNNADLDSSGTSVANPYVWTVNPDNSFEVHGPAFYLHRADGRRVRINVDNNNAVTAVPA